MKTQSPMKTKKLPIKQQLCIACRRCCKSVGMYLDPENYVTANEDVAEFYAVRGFEIYEHEGFLLLIHPDLPCPNLTEKGCRIYSRRPVICKKYSGLDDLGDECLWSSLPEYKKGKKKATKQSPKK
ncbi:MAG TPA: YkgJ family cysteine cluster protein [Dissulfurispiraceae bacterium]|nr:YkgJ family cysteine cluster protein [Dissulfurispiraceae bacterium]